MKKVAIIAFVVFLSTAFSNAFATPSWLINWDEAVTIAKRDGKNLLVEFSTEWCPYCKFIDERIFSDPSVLEKLKGFILLRLDGDKPVTQGYMDKFDVRGFPTFIVFDLDGKEISRFNDVNDVQEMISRLSKAGLLPEEKILEKLESVKDAKKFIKEFPYSPFLPVCYKKLADFYKADSIRQKYLEEAARIIEDRIEFPSQLEPRVLRIVIDQQIDLLADIYKELDPAKVKESYKKGAKLCKEFVKDNGGIKENSHLISTIVYYYMKAGDPGSAIKFLDMAMRELPAYWPIYSNYAKAMTSLGKTDKAISFAKKAYELAEVVARPRVALVWAEVYANNEKFDDAIKVLKNAENDLIKTGSSKGGRAAKMIGQLQERIEEYSSK